jgi:SAM-dependent methyltransferase
LQVRVRFRYERARATPVSEFGETYTREAVLGFPLQPSSHGDAWRYLFDWAVVGDALACGPGDLVLEFGAGSAFASELFNRLGYRTAALDMDPAVLGIARERWRCDTRLDPGRAHFIAGDGMRLPFRTAAFDGIVCLNALHHMPDYEAVLTELRRVLRPGARAAFSEPGRLHDQTPPARLAIERGAVERAVELGEIDRLARKVGFARLILKPYVYPYLVELPYDEFRRYRFHLARTPFTQPDQIARFAIDYHLLFVLEAPGSRPVTSANPRHHGVLQAEITLDPLPDAVPDRGPMVVRARMRNTGAAVWLHAARPFGGQVALGMKVCAANGRVLNDHVFRVPLPRDVAPGESVEVAAPLRLPWLEPGRYQLRFDLLSEQVAWFEGFGSPAVVHEITVPADEPTSRRPHILRAELRVDGLPAAARGGEVVTVRVIARNRGDSRWLSAVDPGDGLVTVGTKLINAEGAVVSDALGRTPLPHDVPPGGEASVECVVPLPPTLPPGSYAIRVDLVHETVAWFEEYGSPVAECALAIGPSRSAAAVPQGA